MGVLTEFTLLNPCLGTLDYVNSLNREFTVLVRGVSGLIRMTTYREATPIGKVYTDFIERLSYVYDHGGVESVLIMYTKDGEVEIIEH